MSTTRAFKVFIDSPSQYGIVELRLRGYGRDLSTQRQDARRQARAYISSLTVRVDSLFTGAEAADDATTGLHIEVRD